MVEHNMLLMSTVMGGFVLVIALLSYLGYRHTKSASDYMLAGRQIHPFIMAISYGSAFISTSAIVGFGGVAAAYGLGLLWLAFMNIFFGIFVGFWFLGRRTRAMGQHLNAKTFPEFLGKRFGSKKLSAFMASIIFIFMPIYTSAVLIGGARVMEQVLNIGYTKALIFFAIAIAIYVIFGGLRGMMYVDALLGSIMVCGILLLLILTYRSCGGVISTHQYLTDMVNLVPAGLAEKGHMGWTCMPRFNSQWWWTLISSLMLGVGIGAMAQPQLAVRFMTVKSDKELSKAIGVGAVFILLTVAGTYLVGALSNVWFYQNFGQLSIQAVKDGNLDLIIPTFITKALPPWFAYIFTITLLSAAMSTLSALLHVIGTSLGYDLFGNIRQGISSILVTKVGIVIAIIATVIIALALPGSFIARATAIFFGICAAAFLPAYVAAIYWKRTTLAGVWCSMISGAFISIFSLLFLLRSSSAPLGVCKLIFGKTELISSGMWPYVDSIVYTLPLSALVLIVVSLMTKNDDKHVEECFSVIKK